MKARQVNLLTSEAEVRAVAEKYIAEQHKLMYDYMAEDVLSQAIAITLGTLEMQYGYKAKRLKEFADNIIAYSQLMSNDRYGIDAGAIRDDIKARYGIDTDEVAGKIFGGVKADV